MPIKYRFKALSKADLKVRIEEGSPQNILTIVSIIQGMALASYVSGAAPIFHGGKFTLPAATAALVSLAAIVSVYFYYNWFAALVIRPPHIRESIIPFAIGVSQIAPTYYFDKPQVFLLWHSVFLISSILGLVNTFMYLDESNFSPDFKVAYKLLRRETIWNIVFCGVMSVVAIATLSLLYFFPLWTSDFLLGVVFCALGFANLAMLYKTQVHFLTPLYENADIQFTNVAP
jgi:hypothetical protein